MPLLQSPPNGRPCEDTQVCPAPVSVLGLWLSICVADPSSSGETGQGNASTDNKQMQTDVLGRRYAIIVQ